MADEDEASDDAQPKRALKMVASLLCQLPLKSPQNSDAGCPNPSIPDPNAPWIAVRGSKTAVIVGDRQVVEVVDAGEAADGGNVGQKTISLQNQVTAMAFSGCGGFLAIADDSGTLSLYKSNGELLFGHRVARPGDSDSVVAIEFATAQGGVTSSDAQDLVAVTASGTLLRLGDLRLAEFEQLLMDKPQGALRVIMRNIRFERAKVGRLNEGSRSCMQVHRVRQEVFIILGNHGSHLSVWRTSSIDKEGHSGIENVSVCESTSAPVDCIRFDSEFKRLVVLSEGKLSWWEWQSMEKLFEAGVTGIGSFAVFGASTSEQKNQQNVALVLVTCFSEKNSSAPSLEQVQIMHSESGDNNYEIDNYLALGLMLSMEQEDAFHAFRRQISRENVAKDFNRFQQLAFIGADAARAWQQIAFLHQCVELEVLHELLDMSCFLDGEQTTEDDSGEFADNFRLVQESFSEAAKREDYSGILGSPFEQGFVEYLAATANIDYLLSQLLEDKRMEMALTAVQLYYEYHPTEAPPHDAAGSCDGETAGSSETKRWELIDAYLASSSSVHLARFQVS
ncbi:Kinetochore component [Phytophthora cinnamomi]|uniref:Kinetochore component n=1 Tax=Phytophthora cinnamomi TaxID=4785 RepID=UPI00355A77A3|nr:Kinetochore component [Phytophthora cinnamomi]